MRWCATVLLFGLVGCGSSTTHDAEDSNLVGEVQPDEYGDYKKYSVRPTSEPELAFLGSAVHAGDFEGPKDKTYRVFELYEDGRIEIAIALDDGAKSTVWNLTETLGVAIDEIESIDHDLSGQIDLWVYEEGAEWARYRVDLAASGQGLNVQRWFYGEYFEPDGDPLPGEKTTFVVPVSKSARYAALPALEKTTLINFEAPTAGSARIFQLAEDGGSRVVVSLRIGNDAERVYDTDAIVRDVMQGYEIEPGYLDLQIDPLCAPPGTGCGIPFDAIGIEFELGEDGRSLESDAITVHLKHGVG